MSLRLSCALDGIPLEQLDAGIRVTDLTEHPAELLLTTARPALGDGSIVTERRRTALRVDVSFTVRERDPLRRAGVMDRVAAWSRGGSLTVSTRPGRMLKVRCTSLPGQGSAADWTAPLTVTFTAYEEPWWQDAAPVLLTLDSIEEPDGFLSVPGTADRTPVTVLVTCLAEEGLTAVTMICGETSVRLEGLSIPAEGWVKLGRDDRGRLTVIGDGGSLLAYRTADSDDELTLPCGTRSAVHLMTDARASAVFSARGRYL